MCAGRWADPAWHRSHRGRDSGPAWTWAPGSCRKVIKVTLLVGPRRPAAEGDEVPAEYPEAMQRCHDAWDALYAATLDGQGEQDMARLVRDNPEEFEQQYEAGRQFFHGPGDEDEGDEEEDWLDLLLDAVT